MKKTDSRSAVCRDGLSRRWRRTPTNAIRPRRARGGGQGLGRSDRDERQRPREIVDAMELKPG